MSKIHTINNRSGHNQTGHNRSWVAFEASVLAQQKFESIAIPFAGSAKLDWYLKLWGKRVVNNDICQWAWWTARARVENNNEQLDEYDLELILKDADEAHGELNNPALCRWFAQSDARWLDIIRANIDGISDELRKALAIFAGILVGDYVLSFTAETEFLRQPLTEVYTDLIKSVNRVIDNQSYNRSANLEALDFIARTKADLLYANLPQPGSMLAFLESQQCWREAWVRGHGHIHEELFPFIKESFGGLVLSKERYLQILSDLLERSRHMPIWAISFQEGQPLSLSEMSEAIKKHRPLQTTYTKDMTDIIDGVNACIIIAGK